MGLSVGIVGLPNVGKSTLFNALSSKQAEAANYPFCTIDPNVGVVPVPDPRRNTTGVWHATTVRGLGKHPLLRAVVESGRRCEGDQRRFTPDGPRPLTAADYRPDGKPKVVNNPSAARVAVPARFAPIIDPSRHEALVAELDRRGEHLRGNARARGDVPNPLGGRVWDLGCGWPMYRLAFS